MFDIVGLLILIVLVAGFGFLLTRAWKVRNAFLKWGGVVLTGLLTLIPTALLVLALIGFYKLNQPHANAVADVHVAGTPAQIARGERLAHICTGCHSPDRQLPLSGNNFITTFAFPPVGTFYAPNLTPSGNIKDWSDGEVIRAIREGVHKNGRSLIVMSSENFRYMSDDDVQAVVAYLRSQPAVGGPTPDNQWNTVGAILINLLDFQTAQAPVGHVTAPQPGTPEDGQYMIRVIGCSSCHGDQLQGRVDNGQPGPPPGPNLTKIVPSWSEAQFMTFFNTGTLPDGSQVPQEKLPNGANGGPIMPWSTVRAVATDAELHDIYTYLHSLKPVEGPTK
jgi:mono/diheme cytochrome c family protein